jgi:pSer/pThr/pTyr-binding forkhead associated (FHA) protein
LRFQLQSPDGVPHEVELQGRIVVVGRDPSCDLVLNDVKCSRRHAVIEAGPDGLTIRDSGSANGVYLNEQKIERAALEPGDRVRLGDSVIEVLPDEVEGTMVMGPSEDGVGEATVGDDAQPPPLPVRPRAAPPAPPPLPRSTVPPVPAAEDGEVDVPLPPEEASGLGRPLTVSVLAALWLMSVPMYALGGLALAARFSGAGAVLTGLLGLTLAGLAAALAWGLWSLAPWARTLQIGVAGLGLLVCPFSLASIVVLAYLLTRTGAAAFQDGPDEGPAQTRMEAGFAAALLATVLLGALVTMLLLFLPRVATRLS